MARKRKHTAEAAFYYDATGRTPPDLSDGEEVRRVKAMTAAQTVEAVELPSDFYNEAGDPKCELPSFADAFPDAFARLTGGRPEANIMWPRGGNNKGLAKIILALLSSEDSDEPLATRLELDSIPNDLPTKVFFHLLNEQLPSNGLWRPFDFLLVTAKVRDAVDEREESRREKLVTFPSGLPKSDRSRRVQKIRETIKCSTPRAYVVERNGTARLDQRLALAEAFKDDPDRCRPVNWELRSRAGTWGRVSVCSFRRYIESGADQFEFDGSVGRGLAILQAQYADGRMPDNFRNLRAFIAAIEDVGAAVDRATAVAIFDAFEVWKKKQP